MWGDLHCDIATNWVGIDMYDELECNAHEPYLAMLPQCFSTDLMQRGQVYTCWCKQHIANYFDITCYDGHYQWYVRNLNGWVPEQMAGSVS